MGDLYCFDYAKDTLINYVDYDIEGSDVTQFTRENVKQNPNITYTNLNTSQIKGKYLYNQWYDPYMSSIYNLESNEMNFVPETKFNYDIPVVPNWVMVTNNIPNAFIIAAQGIEVKNYLNDDKVLESNKKIIREQYREISDDEISETNPLLQIMYVKE